MAAKTHTCCADAAGGGRVGLEEGDAGEGVCVVGFESLEDVGTFLSARAKKRTESVGILLGWGNGREGTSRAICKPTCR